MENRVGILERGSPFKIVSLIASVVTVMACFVGAVTWVSVNVANNAVTIKGAQDSLARHEILINKNSQIIGQHAQLLAILDQHEMTFEQHQKTLEVLTTFMTQGGRFTESDGRVLQRELDGVKDRLRHYEVLETELGWIKKSIEELRANLRDQFSSIGRQMETVGRKQDKVYEMHQGFPHEEHDNP